MNRLERITTVNGTPAVQSRHGYELDALGRRIGAVREDGQKWDYVYNSKGELTSGIKRFADGTALPAQRFGYNYDEIGNLSSSTRSQGQAATPLTQVTYQANALNQYSSINTPGNYTLLAELPAATNTSGVTLNTFPVERWENTVWKNFAIGNTSPVSTTNTLTVTTSSGSTSITGKSLLPKLAAVPTYDFDGNLLSDGVWYYTWDAENRLISQYMVSIPNATRYKLVYAYDSMNRRMEKTVFTTTSTATTPNASSWILASTTRFLYDGWNLVAEYLSTPAVPSYTLVATHLWGADLSESAQGAGGVGGLLSSTLTSGSYFPAYDGNGNITAWLEQSGSRLDKRDYDPFGAVISQFKMTSEPAILDKLPFGFSTKYTDKETGLLYYGYRYYNPTTKRWLNRDLIEEKGGVNLYGFVGNDGVGKWDLLGMIVNNNSNSGSGVNRADGFFDASNKLVKWIRTKYGGNKKVTIDYYGWSSRAHTKNDIIKSAKIFAKNKRYEIDFMFITGHGQIVGENYGPGDVISEEERSLKGAYIAMDSDILSIPLYSELKMLDPRKIQPLLISCFNIPSYKHINGRMLKEWPAGIGGADSAQYKVLDHSKRYYTTGTYGDIGDMTDMLTNQIDEFNDKCYTVSLFQGRFAGQPPSEKGYK